MNVLDTTKQEIKELIDLIRYIEHFDCEIMLIDGIKPTNAALEKRKKAEWRCSYLLKKYT